MGAFGGFSLAMLEVVGVMLGAIIVLALLAVAFLQIWVRRTVANKIYAIFLDQKHLFTALLPVEGDCIYYGKGEKKEKYLLDTNKQFWVLWPPAGSKLIGASVRAHWYVRNRPAPLDPEGKSANLTSRSLRMIGDEAMLKTTWKDIRDSSGVPAGKVRSNITTILLIGLAVLGALNLYLIMNLQKVLSAIAQVIGVG